VKNRITFYRKIYSILAKMVLINKDIRHSEPSIIFSPEYKKNTPNNFLINLTKRSLDLAFSNLITIPKPNLKDAIFFNIFPGEHYRLLNAIAKILKPKIIVEIGTYTGMGSIALRQNISDCTLYTFDIIPWHNFESHLTKNDFKKNIIQVIADLSCDHEFHKHTKLLEKADIIFMDAPKDGFFEYKLLESLSKIKGKKKKLLIIDDIKFVNMIDLWRSIDSPKIDITSFGHWSGTGMVDISRGLNLKT